ncbi:FAD-dependent oxidoreductase [Dactylosporangium aurantiacum]|uniref:FAD-dependent oxidoreductase n=1 Tax=Dactylosporangium aurantiacum TaxID=35754 RepID=A0A9Q9MGD2_9ACTN|nr:FAD-dependent oxidoreductase [Dactylosporangium aurantiacum]MDG6104970.1 FAD-dependent oxidoreductase [Dactylosporangium aurantiacum]UWZ51506.1 FAD-dependent oxidoreductase [Dactylosporangium aurantiacum]
MNEHVRVAIVGGGPAGLTAAAALARRLGDGVLLIEREAETGGIPRHSDHLGYGLRDLHRFVSGPAYARRLTAAARAAGARLETGAMVTGWAGERALEVTSPRGRRVVHADAVVLATGARERPRPARHIPGDRPDGVYTTGQLQQLVHLYHRDVGRRAVVVGADLVSWSAVLTLRAAGCRPVLLATEGPHAVLRRSARVAFGVPVLTGTRVAAINGHGRVTSVDLEDPRTGRRHRVPCDTVVLTGDWIPEHELARTGGLDMDAGTRGPRVDTALATSRPGVFAAGNLLHPVDTADVAALDGRHVAGAVLAHLTGAAAGPARPAGPAAGPAGPAAPLELRCAAPLRWIAPQLIRPGGPAPVRGRLLLWCDTYRAVPHVVAVQDGRRVGAVRVPWPAAPGRVFRVPFTLVAGADPAGGPVTVALDR